MQGTRRDSVPITGTVGGGTSGILHQDIQVQVTVLRRAPGSKHDSDVINNKKMFFFWRVYSYADCWQFSTLLSIFTADSGATELRLAGIMVTLSPSHRDSESDADDVGAVAQVAYNLFPAVGA